MTSSFYPRSREKGVELSSPRLQGIRGAFRSDWCETVQDLPVDGFCAGKVIRLMQGNSLIDRSHDRVPLNGPVD
jgi:hypothetical protein